MKINENRMADNPLSVLEKDFESIPQEVINQFKDGKYNKYLISSEKILAKILTILGLCYIKE
jgi:hypothetical protein